MSRLMASPRKLTSRPARVDLPDRRRPVEQDQRRSHYLEPIDALQPDSPVGALQIDNRVGHTPNYLR